MGFEPMIRVLQTLALPLGHVALRGVLYQRAGVRSSQCSVLLVIGQVKDLLLPSYYSSRAGHGPAPTIMVF